MGLRAAVKRRYGAISGGQCLDVVLNVVIMALMITAFSVLVGYQIPPEALAVIAALVRHVVATSTLLVIVGVFMLIALFLSWVLKLVIGPIFDIDEE